MYEYFLYDVHACYHDVMANNLFLVGSLQFGVSAMRFLHCKHLVVMGTDVAVMDHFNLIWLQDILHFN